MPQSSIWSRRDLLMTSALAGAATRLGANPAPAAVRSKLAIPGSYRGRVIEVGHAGSVSNNKVNAAAVRAMMRRGMCELTGKAEEAQAWGEFFGPNDRVGVKVCPVGKPLSISQPETLLEVFRGLHLAGVKNQNLVLFNRYMNEIIDCKFDEITPGDIRVAAASVGYDSTQVSTVGYDTGVFVEMNRVMTGVDPNDPVNRRSHLANIVSKDLDKIVNVCCLKDHASAGITMALKNLSHGCVNNVCRSHATGEQNWCDTFIPDVLSMPQLREKATLHIGDGLIGTYDGGPGIWNQHFRTWEYRALFFATDPVAMDRVGWEILDRKRAEVGLPPLIETGKRGKRSDVEAFDFRQPQHVLLASMGGLGEADLKKIEHRKIVLS